MYKITTKALVNRETILRFYCMARGTQPTDFKWTVTIEEDWGNLKLQFFVCLYFFLVNKTYFLERMRGEGLDSILAMVRLYQYLRSFLFHNIT